jgi:hypothetical protein
MTIRLLELGMFEEAFSLNCRGRMPRKPDPVLGRVENLTVGTFAGGV